MIAGAIYYFDLSKNKIVKNRSAAQYTFLKW